MTINTHFHSKNYLTQLEISQFRNLNSVIINPSNKINLFYGNNGSGKTSLLEAIYHLSVGRSFRTHLYHRVIQENQDKFTVFGKIAEIPVGIERNRQGDLKIRYEMCEVQSVATLAELLPMQLIDPHCHLLINGGPKIRRQFIDWGVFHVEHSDFLMSWRRFQRTLKQRNAALKKDHSGKEAILWNSAFLKSAKIIDSERKEYINQYSKVFSDIQKRILNIGEISVEYHPGWYNDDDLQTVINESLEGDIKQGYTHYGPHRADIKIILNKVPVSDVLSRGQQKILASIMKIAQAAMLKKETGRKCIFLVDDLPSELDEQMRQALTAELININAQIFVTGIDRDYLFSLFNKNDMKMFHVEHGRIQEEQNPTNVPRGT